MPGRAERLLPERGHGEGSAGPCGERPGAGGYRAGHGAGNGRNADDREETGQAPERDGDGGRAGPDTRAHGRGRHLQRRGLYAEDGLKRLYPPCGPCARPGAGLLAAIRLTVYNYL